MDKIITIQGINIQGQTVACQFYTDGKKKTNWLKKSFAYMHNLANVEVIPCN